MIPPPRSSRNSSCPRVARRFATFKLIAVRIRRRFGCLTTEPIKSRASNSERVRELHEQLGFTALKCRDSELEDAAIYLVFRRSELQLRHSGLNHLGLKPLKLQGLKALFRGRGLSDLKVRPPKLHLVLIAPNPAAERGPGTRYSPHTIR